MQQGLFNVDSGLYDDIKKMHRSYHHSGESHTRYSKKGDTLDKGLISDGSTLINQDEDPLIMALESFNFEQLPEKSSKNDYDILLSVPEGYLMFSILWVFIPPWHANTLPQRMFWVNCWGSVKNIYCVQTSSLSDLLITHEMTEILSIKDWRICACFLKLVLPVIKNHLLIHPKGTEYPWRAFSFVNSHLPLSQMIQADAKRKPAILISHRPNLSDISAHPQVWVKPVEP